MKSTPLEGLRVEPSWQGACMTNAKENKGETMSACAKLKKKKGPH